MNLRVLNRNPYQMYGNGNIGSLRGGSLRVGANRPFRPQNSGGRIAQSMGQAKTADDLFADAESLITRVPANMRQDFRNLIESCRVQRSAMGPAGEAAAMTCINGVNASMTQAILSAPSTGPGAMPLGTIAIVGLAGLGLYFLIG